VKLAFLTPLPPAKTGIADYADLLIRAWCEQAGFPIDVYSNDAGTSSFPVGIRSPSEFRPNGALPIYQVGNSEHHDFLYPLVFEHPGVLVLHDLVLHHSRLRSYIESEAVVEYRRDIGDTNKRARAMAVLDDYRKEVADAYPDRAMEIAEIAIRMGGGRLLYDYPLYEHLVSRSRLTLVHSTTARDEVLAHCPDAKGKVARVRMGVEQPAPISRDEARERLGLGPGRILASFGLVTPEKRIRVALRALRRLRDQGVDARYVLVGGTVGHFDARAEADALGLQDAVDVVGRVSEERFRLYAYAADLCLNLRYPSAGETSATLLRLLACGRAVLVTDQLHVTDFPHDVVARTTLDGEEDGLYCDLVDLLRDDARLRALEERARAFAAIEHTKETMVADYVRAIESL
jgi:glycosyltransferase involved in cell wall biosynthesis